MIDIANRIRDTRKTLGLTQVEFCEYFDLSLRTLRSIEKGDVSVNFANLLQIIQACDLRPELRSMHGGDLSKLPLVFPIRTPERDELLARLKKIKPYLARAAGLKKIGLFGSFARNQDKFGDIDVIALVDEYDLEKDTIIFSILSRNLGIPNLDLTVECETNLENSRFGNQIKGDVVYA